MIDRELAARVAYQIAAADLLRAARDFATAAARLAHAAREWDTDGTREDAAVTALVDATEGAIAVAARSAPGVRAMLRAATDTE